MSLEREVTELVTTRFDAFVVSIICFFIKCISTKNVPLRERFLFYNYCYYLKCITSIFVWYFFNILAIFGSLKVHIWYLGKKIVYWDTPMINNIVAYGYKDL